MDRSLILIGAGGHCRSVIDVVEKANIFSISGIIDHTSDQTEVLGHKLIGTDDQIPYLITAGHSFHIAIGHIKTNTARVRVFENIKRMNGQLPVIVSPRAIISKHAKIGEGSIIMHNAVVNAGACIGSNCIINTGAVIEHDTKVGAHCHISTGAYINGGCTIGDHCFIGSNATLLQCISIGNNVIVGAGSVVIKNLPVNCIAVGNPAIIKNIL